jgi:hypothetical protein
VPDKHHIEMVMYSKSALYLISIKNADADKFSSVRRKTVQFTSAEGFTQQAKKSPVGEQWGREELKPLIRIKNFSG